MLLIGRLIKIDISNERAKTMKKAYVQYLSFVYILKKSKDSASK